ncbi:MAG TPA: nucleotide sugar dehydrogenase [Gaiellaceae bacterium]|jgi:UDP-N-acetyl-D-glucosamine dehydrogenase|nr:nucleotide sugar dehydrogenase [Gaiellaceae bacterium]
MPSDPSPPSRAFSELVASRDARVAVVGLGYVGLPLAVAYAEAGFDTIGLDVDGPRIEALAAGHSHVDDIGDDRLAAIVTAGRLRPTASVEALKEADAVWLCVPTPFDATKTPDLSFVRAAAETVGGVLRPGMLVILQSTTYPGTTTEVVQPILEQASGLRAGVDFHLAYSPERVDPGNDEWTLSNTPKICGGVSAACSEAARALLEAMMAEPGLVKVVSSPAVAEMAKLAENTYRAVNIAYVNELAMLAHEMHIDIWDVMEAAATKPFGYQSFMPGIGPGGQCIPVNPYYISWRAREFDFHTSFIELAGDINLRMTSYAMYRIFSFANRCGVTIDGARVLCLGAAFKARVSDVRNSRAVRVMELLEAEGAQVDFCDPLVATLTLGGTERAAVPVDAADLDGYDLIVVLVRNAAWPVSAVLASSTPTFDAVNALGPVIDRTTHERL